MHKSREVRIETATSCNYNCIMCPREIMTRTKQVMSMEVFLQMLEKLKSHRHIELITFAGFGESFLDNTLLEKILEVKSRGYKVHLITTGVTLNQTSIDILCIVEVEELRFSFYATTKEVYKQVHGSDSFDKVLANIKEVLRRPKTERPKVILEFIEVEENKHQLKEWREYWKDKADVIEAWKPHNWATPCLTYRVLDRKNRRTCGRPFSGPYQIQVDGTMNVCCFDFDNQLKIGNLLKQTLKDILTNDPMLRIQEAHIANDYKGLVCDHCDQLQEHDDVCIFSSIMNQKERVLRTSSGLDLIRK